MVCIHRGTVWVGHRWLWVVTPPNCVIHSVTITGPFKSLFPCLLICSLSATAFTSLLSIAVFILGQVLRKMLEAAWGIYIFFSCRSVPHEKPLVLLQKTRMLKVEKIYSSLNYKPLECVSMYLKQIFGGKWAIIPFSILVASPKKKWGICVTHCRNKGCRARTEIRREGTCPTPWNKTRQRHRENSTVGAEGRNRDLKETQWKKKNIPSPIFFFFFFINLNLPGVALSTIPNERCYK